MASATAAADSPGIVVVGPEQQVAAVVIPRTGRRQFSQPSGEVLMVEAGVEVDNVHRGGVAVLHRRRHHQQVRLHTLPQAAHLHRCIKR